MMNGLRYLGDVSTLQMNEDVCSGCGMCETVCPHAVFAMENGTARILDRDLCMECGACAKNCPLGAVSVTPGVGCAAYIIQSWLRRSKGACGCGQEEASGCGREMADVSGPCSSDGTELRGNTVCGPGT
jgi:NAD-dependent dihydropyrimidine dehydrogenase PreA subunit